MEPVVEYSRGNPINGAATPNSVVTGQLAGVGAITHHVRGNLNLYFDFRNYGELALGGGYIRDIITNMSREGEPGLYGRTNRRSTTPTPGPPSRWSDLRSTP